PPLQSLLSAPGFGQLAGDLLKNGSFETGTFHWQFENHLGYGQWLLDDSTAHDGYFSARISQSDPSAGYYQIQLKQTDFPLEEEQNYLLSFWAKSESPRPINVAVMENDAP